MDISTKYGNGNINNGNGNGTKKTIHQLPAAELASRQQLPPAIIESLPPSATTESEIIPTEADLKGSILDPWTEPSWVQCQQCTKVYKPGVAEFHKRICSAPLVAVSNSVGKSTPKPEPEPESERIKIDSYQPSGTIGNALPAAVPTIPQPDPNTMATLENNGITCNTCHRTFLNSIRYRNHACGSVFPHETGRVG